MLGIARKYKTVFLLLGIVVIYLLQFLMFPNCLSKYYPVSNEAWSILLVPLLVFSVFVNIILDVNVARWAIADILYAIMVIVYSGPGLYGIGTRGFAIDGMSPVYSLELTVLTALVIAVALFSVQILVRAIRLVLLKVMKSKAQ